MHHRNDHPHQQYAADKDDSQVTLKPVQIILRQTQDNREFGGYFYRCFWFMQAVHDW